MSPNLYTRTGDDGSTALLGDARVFKDDPRLEAVGTLDEANAALGAARAVCRAAHCREILLTVQRDLYGLMAETAATPENAARFRSITAERVNWLEAQIAEIEQTVPPLKEFIIPGDTPAGAALDLARAVVRRAERRLVALHREAPLANLSLLRYINRLSSLCFALELLENQQAGAQTLAKD